VGYVHHLETRIWLPQPLELVFGFFANARNLDLLTPPWLHFRIRTPGPIEMGRGATIAYELRLRGIPLRWQSEIAIWEPPYRFVDVQRRGPYRRWAHEHTFAEQAGGTLVSDHVVYAVPGGILVQRLLVAPDLRRLFRYRQAKLAEIFGGEERPGPPTIAACGPRLASPDPKESQ
jgi:ligand-binding SRPBCC domain-containing protein